MRARRRVTSVLSVYRLALLKNNFLKLLIILNYLPNYYKSLLAWDPPGRQRGNCLGGATFSHSHELSPPCLAKFCLPNAKTHVYRFKIFILWQSVRGICSFFLSFLVKFGAVPAVPRAALSSLHFCHATKCFETLTCRDPKLFHRIPPSQVIRRLILGCQYLHCWEWEEIPPCQSSWISAELPGNSSLNTDLVQGPANPRDQISNGNKNNLLACCFKHLQRCGRDFSLLPMIFFFQIC